MKKRVVEMPWAMTARSIRAINRGDAVIAAAIEHMKNCGVPQGVIVSILQGHNHQETARMLGGDV